MSYTKEEIQQALDIHNAEVQAKVEAMKKEVMPELITNLTSRKDELPGVQFSTGNIDDMYEIKKAEADEGGVEGLVVFQTWNNENEEEFLYTDELSFDQLEEIFNEITN